MIVNLCACTINGMLEEKKVKIDVDFFRKISAKAFIDRWAPSLAAGKYEKDIEYLNIKDFNQDQLDEHDAIVFTGILIESDNNFDLIDVNGNDISDDIISPETGKTKRSYFIFAPQHNKLIIAGKGFNSKFSRYFNTHLTKDMCSTMDNITIKSIPLEVDDKSHLYSKSFGTITARLDTAALKNYYGWKNIFNQSKLEGLITYEEQDLVVTIAISPAKRSTEIDSTISHEFLDYIMDAKEKDLLKNASYKSLSDGRKSTNNYPIFNMLAQKQIEISDTEDNYHVKMKQSLKDYLLELLEQQEDEED